MSFFLVSMCPKVSGCSGGDFGEPTHAATRVDDRIFGARERSSKGRGMY